ncbi:MULTISPECIES: carboxypeptidase regulatory-like domain-containing protein [unclassified Burkholderia]|uniref:carboxypeptidase regulatory-like domain-containing protein n=1 Tax=unclassified Burkholderia TaxID=2613784 RepID=UPI001E4F8056|nr:MULTISPECIES: carboxypeptidase regulatory-like domain-containing protein [unclassified Burkholderia]UEP32117.1 carboxypeptidase regulatory-like domain-containing protein [Burkholderia sp. B21-007]UEP45296.1 carboxypeptidase regulatory-like domain-containing protein [Burkholderia sp. B21-005]
MSGGIGLDQSIAIKGAMRGYVLVLTFIRRTRGGNEYLSDVLVTITGMKGNTVPETPSDGRPFMLANLRIGRCAINASYKGRSERYIVDAYVHLVHVSMRTHFFFTHAAVGPTTC